MVGRLRFSFLLRPREAEALKRIAESMDRSQGAALRTLIRKADRELGSAGLLPTDSPTPADRPMPITAQAQGLDHVDHAA